MGTELAFLLHVVCRKALKPLHYAGVRGNKPRSRLVSPPMDRATNSIPPLPAVPALTTFGRLRDWWQGLAASFMPARGSATPDRATARLIAQLKQLFEDSKAQRGGEISARGRARQIAAIYRNASLPQRM